MSNLTEKCKLLMEQGKTLLFSMTASQIIAGMLGAVIILLIAHLIEPPPKPIGTVDITGIVNQFVKSQAKLDLPPKVLQQRVDAFGQQLQTALNTIARQHQVVLMVQEAVVAGGHDYTDEVKAHIKQLPSPANP